MSAPIPREEKTAAGIGLMFVAVIFFTGIDTSAKLLTIAGIPVIQIVFVRYFGHFVFAIVCFAHKEGRDLFVSRAPGKQFLRSVFLFGSTICNFFALQSLPITVTTTIFFAGPIVVTLLAIPLLGERVGIRRFLAVCTGFIGVLIVMQPWGEGFHPAMLFSLAALIIASLYFVMTRMLSGVETNATQQVWSAGLASVVLAPFALWSWTWPVEWSGWMVMFLIGAFGATGHILATGAHRLADASILAPVIYVQLFLAAFVGIVIFGSWPTPWTLAGGAIIIASGLYIWQRERRLA
jgi:drug/metabolite transporter (DMT)-like permease